MRRIEPQERQALKVTRDGVEKHNVITGARENVSDKKKEANLTKADMPLDLGNTGTQKNLTKREQLTSAQSRSNKSKQTKKSQSTAYAQQFVQDFSVNLMPDEPQAKADQEHQPTTKASQKRQRIRASSARHRAKSAKTHAVSSGARQTATHFTVATETTPQHSSSRTLRGTRVATSPLKNGKVGLTTQPSDLASKREEPRLTRNLRPALQFAPLNHTALQTDTKSQVLQLGKRQSLVATDAKSLASIQPPVKASSQPMRSASKPRATTTKRHNVPEIKPQIAHRYKSAKQTELTHQRNTNTHTERVRIDRTDNTIKHRTLVVKPKAQLPQVKSHSLKRVVTRAATKNNDTNLSGVDRGDNKAPLAQSPRRISSQPLRQEIRRYAIDRYRHTSEQDDNTSAKSLNRTATVTHKAVRHVREPAKQVQKAKKELDKAGVSKTNATYTDKLATTKREGKQAVKAKEKRELGHHALNKWRQYSEQDGNVQIETVNKSIRPAIKTAKRTHKLVTASKEKLQQSRAATKLTHEPTAPVQQVTSKTKLRHGVSPRAEKVTARTTRATRALKPAKSPIKTHRLFKLKQQQQQKFLEQILWTIKRAVMQLAGKKLIAGIVVAVATVVIIMTFMAMMVFQIATLMPMALQSHQAQPADMSQVIDQFTYWKISLYEQARTLEVTFDYDERDETGIANVLAYPYWEPMELMSFLTVRYGNFEFTQAYPLLRAIFEAQYQLPPDWSGDFDGYELHIDEELAVLVVILQPRPLRDVLDAFFYDDDERDHWLFFMESFGNRGMVYSPFNFFWHPYISSHFGHRPDPFGSGHKVGHRGTDIALPQGTPILAGLDGVVAHASYSATFGNWVQLQNGAGLVVIYAHMHQMHVSAGQQVRAGEVIGTVGTTGASTGNHLHIEVIMYSTPTYIHRHESNVYLDPFFFVAPMPVGGLY